MDAVYYFEDAQRRIVIRQPRLPAPWINYLSNGTLHAFVSQAGGGCVWWKSPLKSRISRYRQYNLPLDSPGFYVYVREGEGRVWAPMWRPVEAELDEWRAEHEPGLTRFVARRGELEAQVEFFIGPEVNALIWEVRLRNRGKTAVKVDIFAYVELSLLDWKQDTDWACYVKHNLQVTRDAASEALVYLYRHFHFNPQLGECPLLYFASDGTVASFCGDRDAFVGPYRTERDPVAVERNDCGNVEMYCGDPCFALQCPVEVKGEGEARVCFFLGGEAHAIIGWPRALEGVRASVARLRRAGEVERLKEGLRAWWDEHLGALQVSLPDADIARQVNVWNPVQCVHTGRYSRSFSQHAAGVRTMGYRDTCQDMLAIAYRRPTWAREVFRYLVSQQYEDGHTPHQCNPVEKLPAEAHIHIDNPLWLIMLGYALLAETGDLGLLEEEVPWLSSADHLSLVGSASVWEHLLRVVAFMEANLGAHGIPLIHHGDWNDSIRKFAKRGKGESVFAAQQYVYVLRQLAGMARLRGEHGTAERLDGVREKQERAILACGWDGAWWRRGYDDDGAPIGSASCTYGKIWLNSQSWAVLASVGTREQQCRAMDAVAELLDTGVCGIKKLHPSFQSFPEVEDPYSGYSPGCGENGAIFCHANTWAIIAEALLGRAERAWHYYRQLVPHLALQRIGLERYQAEPYAYVSNIVGPENPKFGWANVTQVTGTAAWMDIAATQYLLGIRAELEGLRIAPVLPAAWEGFRARRRFRGCEVEISVRRARGGEACGVVCEGQLMENNVVPAAALAGRSHARVEVILPVGSGGSA
ncbi:MAG: hypothetical protein N2595_10435 [bacterium]|nr:hypothetical protein [bacterium]